MSNLNKSNDHFTQFLIEFLCNKFSSIKCNKFNYCFRETPGRVMLPCAVCPVMPVP